MKKSTYLILYSLVITIILWFLSKSSINEVIQFPFISINQIAALLGTILFAWSMILSTRLRFIENLFEGLEKVYHAHRNTSQWGFALILIHPIALALSSTRENLSWFVPIHDNLSLNLGIISFWLFVYFVILTLLIKQLEIKYDFWKSTHKFLNIAMILALLHIILVKSDTSIYLPLGIWIYTITGIGVIAGLYKLFFYNTLASHYTYIIDSINQNNDIYEIFLKPKTRKLKHSNGQYVYASFLSKNVSTESHPFCIASKPEEELLRLVIKELGDFTKTLSNLQVGEEVVLYGPHGKLSKELFVSNDDAVFIAGGIGIAPFLSMFTNIQGQPNKNIFLYYSTKSKQEAYFDNELTKVSKENSNLHYYNQCTRAGDGHLNIKTILQGLGNPQDTNFFLCANPKMMKSIIKELVLNGVNKRRIFSEDYEV